MKEKNNAVDKGSNSVYYPPFYCCNLEKTMKKLLFIPMFLMCFVSLSAASSWDCSGDADCPEGTTCNAATSSCAIIKEKVADYAAVTLSLGEKNRNSLGSDKIFIKNPATDLVLGQLAVEAYAGNGDGRLYFIQELSADLSVYPSSSIKFEDFKLVYDANGNGEADPSERVVAAGVTEGFGVHFDVDKRYSAFKMNQKENLLIVGSFSSETEINDITNFNAIVKSNYIVTKTSQGEGAVAATQPISFPKFSFEPEKGYFLFSSGEYFPKAPAWTELNKEHEIMHLRLKALDGSNELDSLKINLYGTSVSFGNGVDKITLCTDRNNDGKCDEVIAEFSDFAEPQQSVLFQIPAGKTALNEGEETFLVVKAALNFYKDQNSYFYITDSDVNLKTKQKIAGTQIKTESFKYNCKEDNPDCRLKPEEPVAEEEKSDSGCTLLFVD